MHKVIKWKVLGAVAAIAATLVFSGCSEMMSRDDFAARVRDKSDAEVAKLVGKPAVVETTAPDQVAWVYNSKTFNVEERNKFDTKTVVVFAKSQSDGKLKAVDVKFE
jgi:hypothetical protein